MLEKLRNFHKTPLGNIDDLPELGETPKPKNSTLIKQYALFHVIGEFQAKLTTFDQNRVRLGIPLDRPLDELLNLTPAERQERELRQWRDLNPPSGE